MIPESRAPCSSPAIRHRPLAPPKYHLQTNWSVHHPSMPRVRNPKATRQRILAAAHGEFYRHGYRAGSLNDIVTSAGVTKGALFHHFTGKQALAIALIDDGIGPVIHRRWIEPLESADNPLDLLAGILASELERIEREGEDGFVSHGCPVANLAADAAAVEEPVRERLDALYQGWRSAIAGALQRGQRAGTVHPNVVPADEAAFLVAALAGIATTGKVSRDIALHRSAFRAATAYLETLRPPA
jgi:TetR/AcrR family transcriptional repressor of nem operon